MEALYKSFEKSLIHEITPTSGLFLVLGKAQPPLKFSHHSTIEPLTITKEGYCSSIYGI